MRITSTLNTFAECRDYVDTRIKNSTMSEEDKTRTLTVAKEYFDEIEYEGNSVLYEPIEPTELWEDFITYIKMCEEMKRIQDETQDLIDDGIED